MQSFSVSKVSFGKKKAQQKPNKKQWEQLLLYKWT